MKYLEQNKNLEIIWKYMIDKPRNLTGYNIKNSKQLILIRIIYINDYHYNIYKIEKNREIIAKVDLVARI